jgi:hypothetical protein
VFVTFAHGFPLFGRLVVNGDLPHDGAGLLREVHRCADDDHGFDAVRLEGGHVQKDVASHAEADGLAFVDAEVVKERESVQGALAVRNGFVGVCGATVAAGVRGDKSVFAQEFIAAGIGPIIVAAAPAM